MDVNDCFNLIRTKKIKYTLVFFCWALLMACTPEKRVRIDQVDYDDEKAIGVTFTTAMDVEQLRVFIGTESQQSVIGVIVSDGPTHHFTPVIPFTPGENYTLRKADTLVMASFRIPKRRVAPNEVLGIYPNLDTVPENLLKMYIEFAKPMQEVGNALDHIKVINTTDSAEVKPFLRLETELWNQNRTLLTLWLDPGRIKTDLIPNREQGLPLTAGKRYHIAIDSGWKSKDGATLKQGYTKTYDVGPRDDHKPSMTDWRLWIGERDTTQSLYLDFKEPMDAFLALETIQLYDTDNKHIMGRFNRTDSDAIIRFIPEKEWPGPEIEIRVQSRLEDLAGNNLNRLFDAPVRNTERQSRDTLAVRTMRFGIR